VTFCDSTFTRPAEPDNEENQREDGIVNRNSYQSVSRNADLRAAAAVLVLLLMTVGASAQVCSERPNIYGSGLMWAEWLDPEDLPEEYQSNPRAYNQDQMDLIADMDGTMCHGSFDWIVIEPTQGTYDWTQADEHVADAVARGLTMYAYIGNTPEWARPPNGLPGYRTPPDEDYKEDFEDYCTAVAERYEGEVEHFFFWNEPNGCSWINDGCSNMDGYPLYTHWLKRAYTALKAGNPNCKVGAGVLDYNEYVPHGYTYLQGMYSEGAKGYFDAVAIHPYASDGVHWNAILDTRSVMLANDDGDKEIWINEYGWSNSGGSQAPTYLTDFLEEIKQPQYHYVTMCRYLVMSDLPDGSHGLCNRELTPRPIYTAFCNFDKSCVDTPTPTPTPVPEPIGSLSNMSFQTSWSYEPAPNNPSGWWVVEWARGGPEYYTSYELSSGRPSDHRCKFEIGGPAGMEYVIGKEIAWGEYTEVDASVYCAGRNWDGSSVGTMSIGIDRDGSAMAWSDADQFTNRTSSNEVWSQISVTGVTKPAGATTFTLMLRATRSGVYWNCQFDEASVVGTAMGPTNTPAPTDTPGPTNTPGGEQEIASEDFETMPSWSSSHNAGWGSAATWSIQSGGESGNFLQAWRPSQGSSAKVKVYDVPQNTAITLSIYMRCPSMNNYWMETAFRLGNHSAQDFDENSGAWTMIQKFDSYGGNPNGNGNVWTYYSEEVNTGSNTQISVGYKLGSSGTGTYNVGWDTFELIGSGIPPTSTPVPTDTPVPTNTPIPTDTPVHTNTPVPTDTPVPTITPTNTPSGFLIEEDFDSMPAWSSSHNAGWGSAANWSIQSGGQSGNYLRASRPSQGSSAKVKVYSVPQNTDITISIYMRCPSMNNYWMETAYRLGSHSAQDFDENSGAWTMVQKFDSYGGNPNGNGNTWTYYSKEVNTGSYTQISIGFKLGSSGTGTYDVGWDTLCIGESELFGFGPDSLMNYIGWDNTLRFIPGDSS
jgi:hypothetical protein